VRVCIKGTPVNYAHNFGEFIYNKTIKMFHFDTRTQEQAIQKGAKHGEVLSCHKFDRTRKLEYVNNLKLDQIPLVTNQYKDAIAMDEMIWQKQIKKRKNLYKDKKGVDI